MKLFFPLAVAILIPVNAMAQSSATEYPMIGAGARSKPEYDGSNAQRAEAVPVVRYYGEHWFTRSTRGVFEGGLRTNLAPGLALGAQLVYEPGRAGSKAAFLRDHNVPDINPGASFGVHLEWDQMLGPVPLDTLVRVRKHIDAGRGTQADLRVTAGIFQSGPFAAGIYGQAIWASAKSDGAWYGITPQQSLTTGLPAYDAGSGLLNASAGLIGSLDLGKTWVMVGSIENRWLRGNAARSPLAERTSNHYLTLGVAYRF